MSLMTKVKTVTGIIVVALVAAVAMHVNPSAFKVTTGDDSDNYVFSVTWHPVNMTHKNHIVVTVDGFPLIVRDRNLSPWGDTATIAKGAKVKLTASLHTVNLVEMDCMIMRNGKSVPHTGFDKRKGPGTVTCRA